MKKLLSLAAMSFLVAAFSFAGSARAEGVEDRIRALESELSKLKAEQIEMKKEAAGAAAAMPVISHRPGSGATIEGADKGWSLTFRNRFNGWMLFRQGDPAVRAGTGEFFLRRFRPGFTYCLNNCFYEMVYTLDEDGFASDSEIQEGSVSIHLEQINPWLPTFQMGIDFSGDWARRRSSSSDAMLDFDMLTRSFYNTGSQTWAYNFSWQDKPLFGIGRLGWFGVTVGAGPATSGEGQGRFSDNKDYTISFGIEPFAQIKNKWISGLEWSFGAWFCNPDMTEREVTDVNAKSTDVFPEGCFEARIRETDGPVRANMWRHRGQNEAQSGLDRSEYWNHLIQNGLRWRIGPYQFLGNIGFVRFQDSPARHRNWSLAHQVFVWSPKGFLTGSTSTPGSLLLGAHFERSDAHASVRGGGANNFCRLQKTPLHGNNTMCNNHVTMNSVGLYYFIQRGMRIGAHWNHYDAHRLDPAVRDDLNINGTAWDNFFLVFDWTF